MSEEEAKHALKACQPMPRYLQLRRPMGEPWCPPALTPEQQKAQDEYVAKHNLPF